MILADGFQGINRADVFMRKTFAALMLTFHIGDFFCRFKTLFFFYS